jgi:hypothetical protein
MASFGAKGYRFFSIVLEPNTGLQNFIPQGFQALSYLVINDGASDLFVVLNNPSNDEVIIKPKETIGDEFLVTGLWMKNPSLSQLPLRLYLSGIVKI